MSYAVIRNAIVNRQCVSGHYDGGVRHFAPHALGKNNDGQQNVMGFQYGGYSSSGLPSGGMWRCFRLDKLSGVQTNGDDWHTGQGHSKPNTCVTQIDVSV